MKRLLLLLFIIVSVSGSWAQKTKDRNLRPLRSRKVASPSTKIAVKPMHSVGSGAHGASAATAANQSLSKLEQQQNQSAAQNAKSARVNSPALFKDPSSTGGGNKSQSLASPPVRKKTGTSATRTAARTERSWVVTR